MTEIHPAFDPTDKVWFTDDGVEAPTLRELQAKMPGVEIVGYRPLGSAPVIVLRESRQPAPAPRPRPSAEPAGVASALGPPPPAPAPVAAEPVSAEPAVAPPKAAAPPRKPPVRWTDWGRGWPPDKIARLRVLAEEAGFSARQIGNILGCSRGAVIGQARRAGIKLKHRRGGAHS